MKWLTTKSRLQQANKPNKWYLIDNELFQDEDGSIYLVPRNYLTDNYTIPDWVAWVAGCKSKYDVRPAHIHDFGCQFKQLLKVRLNEQGLRKLGYMRKKDDIFVCEDIPREFLEVIPVTKWEIDCLFKRAMRATREISNYTSCVYRGGVFFNIGWLGKHKAFDLNKIYTISQNEG